jgi:hypothetical protein
MVLQQIKCLTLVRHYSAYKFILNIHLKFHSNFSINLIPDFNFIFILNHNLNFHFDLSFSLVFKLTFILSLCFVPKSTLAF